MGVVEHFYSFLETSYYFHEALNSEEMSSFLCDWEQALRSLLLLQGDLPTGSLQLRCTLKSGGAAVKMHHKENRNCSATLHMAAYPPASSCRCKASATGFQSLPGDARCTLEDGIMPLHGDGLWQLPLQLQPSLCAATKPSVQRKREKIPQGRAILTASVDSSSRGARGGVQPTSKQLPVPFSRLACALVSKIT